MGATRFNKFYQFGSKNAAGANVGQAVSGTTTYTSPISSINQQHNIGLDITFIGTMTGTLTVNCCNDGINFKPLTFSPAITQPSGGDLSYLINLNQVPYLYLQVIYTNASGSGTLTSILGSKDLS